MSKPTKTARIPENQSLSESEQKIIEKCKSLYQARLDEHKQSDNTLIRFVRGYKDSEKPEEKAIEMLGSMLNWRDEVKINEIIQAQYPKEPLFKSIWTSGIHGVDKEGHIVYIDKVGAVDGSLLYKNFTMEEIVHFHIQQMESITRIKDEISVKTGRRYYKQLVILDLKGLGMSHLGSKFTEPMKKFIKIDQEYYPETLFTMIIVNAGFIVKSGWAIISPWLDPITKSNIKFGEAELKNYMDADQIPKYLGGNCRCEKCLITEFIPGVSNNNAAASDNNNHNNVAVAQL